MSTVILDTITGKSTATTITIGSTPVVSASANSMTIRGEGSNQTSIQQGLAKSWVNFNGTGTIAIRDSHNVSSLTDVNTGNYKYNYTNAMSTADYAYVGGVGEWNLWTTGNTPNTAYANLNCYNGSGLADHAYLMAVTFGA